MAGYAEFAEVACDAYLESLKRSQESALVAVRAFAHHLSGSSLSFLRAVEGASVQEVAAVFVRFAERLVANQREYGQALLEATSIDETSGP